MLILLLKTVIFGAVTLWSLLTRLIFTSIAFLLVMLIQGFKGSGEAALGGFQQLAEALRTGFEFMLGMLVEVVSSVVSTGFDMIQESVTSSVGVAGSRIGELAETTRTSIEEAWASLLELLGEILGEISDMVSTMVTDLWENYKGAVGYVTENA